MITFKEYENIDSNISWVATEDMTDSDWPVRFVIKMIYTEYYDREWAKQGRYHFEIHATAWTAVAPVELDNCLASMGLVRDNLKDSSPESLAIVLVEAGLSPILWQQTGNNRQKLFKAAKDEMQKICMLFGFYMDKQVNGMGNTGWDAIRGGIGKRPGHYDPEDS